MLLNLHTSRLFLAGLLAASVALYAEAPVPASGNTTVVLVRHAEKATDDPRDPSLSAAGQKRAAALAAALEAADVKAVYATQFKRTRATAEPLARRLGLSVVERPVAGDASVYARDLAHEVLAQQAGKTVLVVGHSNTVPELVKAFSGVAVAPITDEEYDHLFIVVVPSSGAARLVKTRYGAPGTP
ncbi:MAG TPA: phosphoglycerate mutase family protein [Thermoanaerobaculia bacterium]|nr:phosphoglycerate mutase family protein [Thermoanaerobaculia bacterium]